MSDAEKIVDRIEKNELLNELTQAFRRIAARKKLYREKKGRFFHTTKFFRLLLP